MDLPEAELSFLRDLVKASRQRTQHLKWTDRDGTARVTAVTAAELARLTALGRPLKIGPAEVLRRAAHIPVARPPGPKPEVPPAAAHPAPAESAHPAPAE